MTLAFRGSSRRLPRRMVVGLSAANTHDSQGLKLMAVGLQSRHDPRRGRHHKPGRPHADKAYGIPDLRRWLREKRIGVRIARKRKRVQ